MVELNLKSSRLMQSPVVGVGVILRRSDGLFLIGRRAKSNEFESWCLPGGHVERGETFEEAAIREVTEETGISSVETPKVFAILLNTKMNHPHVTIGLILSAKDGCDSEIKPEQGVFLSWEWTNIKDVPTPLFEPSEAFISYWSGNPLPSGWFAHGVTSPPEI